MKYVYYLLLAFVYIIFFLIAFFFMLAMLEFLVWGAFSINPI